MSGPTTPKKQKTDNAAMVASPGPSRTLEFDFWAERAGKIPKSLQADLERCELQSLEVSKFCAKTVTVMCIKTLRTDKVFKAALQDASGLMVAVLFGNEASSIREILKHGEWYDISNFEVRNENPEYLTGAVNDLQLFFKPNVTTNSKLTEQDMRLTSPKTIQDVKLLADNTLVDVLCICVKEWGQSITTRGTARYEFALTDKSKETIRLTILGDDGSQLVGSEDKVILLKNVSVSSYDGKKCIQTKWFSDSVMEPDTEEASDMKEWYHDQLEG